MKKIYFKPEVEFHAVGLTALMAASGSGSWEHDKTPGTEENPNIPGGGTITPEEGGESFSKYNAWDEWEE